MPVQLASRFIASRDDVPASRGAPAGQLGDQRTRPVVGVGVGPGDAPLHQLLGSDAYAYATAKVKTLTDDIAAGRELARTTDHA